METSGIAQHGLPVSSSVKRVRETDAGEEPGPEPGGWEALHQRPLPRLPPEACGGTRRRHEAQRPGALVPRVARGCSRPSDGKEKHAFGASPLPGRPIALPAGQVLGTVSTGELVDNQV